MARRWRLSREGESSQHQHYEPSDWVGKQLNELAAEDQRQRRQHDDEQDFHHALPLSCSSQYRMQPCICAIKYCSAANSWIGGVCPLIHAAHSLARIGPMRSWGASSTSMRPILSSAAVALLSTSVSSGITRSP